MSDLFKGYGVAVSLKEDFNVVVESLSRIGFASKTDKVLYQSCHIFHKRDPNSQQSRYAILHFKELFAFDGKPAEITDDDIARRNTIVDLLAQWDLLEPLNLDAKAPRSPMNNIKVVKYNEKADWKFVKKYSIGGK